MARINLRKFLSDHYKGGVSARDVIREAITNSIHAGANYISVDLRFSDKQSEMFKDASERVVLEEISIHDDGEGFTPANLNYFDEICTSHKDDIGGKGVGRLAFLKYARRVSIRSQLEGELIEFPYTPEFKLSDVKNTVCSGKRETEITLSDLNDRINTHVKNLVLSLCDDLRLLVFLKYRAGQSITLDFHHNSGQPFPEDFSLVGSEIKTEMEDSFDFMSETFNCYLFKDAPPAKGIIAMLCADEICVEDYVISKRFDSCRFQISVTSKYFNTRANSERKQLVLPKTDQDADLASPISRDSLMRKIHEACMGMISEIGKADVDNFRESNVRKLQKYYPFIDVSSLGGGAALLDADEVIKTYRAQQSKKEDQLVEALQAGTPVSWDDVSHLASEDLARFIVHRALVIDSLSKMPSDAAENAIHNAILPKKSDGKNIRENNVWLVDDKFLSYSSVFSDETLSKIVSEVNDTVEKSQNRKPDVAAFFSEDNQKKPNKLVIVEFKKLSADVFDNNKALMQCRLYANDLVDRIETIREVFAFAIVEVDDPFYRDMKQTGFRDVFSMNDRVLYNDFLVGRENDIPLHMYVMPATALISDAKARNRVFEEVLRFNVEEGLRENS